MREITPNEAFSKAPPRHPAVLCIRAPGGGTDLIQVEWFNWLNTRRQPMIMYSMFRNAKYGTDLREDDPLVLTFPPAKMASKYKEGFRVGDEDIESGKFPAGVELIRLAGIGVAVPADSQIVLVCTLGNAYNYPFKKVRIFNCNLEEAYSCES